MGAIPAAGVSLLSFFVPQQHVDPAAPPGIVADAIDPVTGEYISLTRGFDPTDASVMYLLKVKRGSGEAVRTVGQRFQDLKLLDSTAQSFFLQETQRALSKLISTGQIQLLSVTYEQVTADPTQAQVEVRYLNAARQAERKLAISAGELIR